MKYRGWMKKRKQIRIVRLHVKRKEWVRGLVNIGEYVDSTTKRLEDYIRQKNE